MKATAAKSKSIQVVPDATKAAKIAALALKLGKSHAGFCELALDTFIPLLESGEWVVLNGKALPKSAAAEALKTAA